MAQDLNTWNLEQYMAGKGITKNSKKTMTETNAYMAEILGERPAGFFDEKLRNAHWQETHSYEDEE